MFLQRFRVGAVDDLARAGDFIPRSHGQAGETYRFLAPFHTSVCCPSGCPS